MRCSKASNENTLPCGTTISPSSTNVLEFNAPTASTTSGK
jgi:hypothetical protein